MGEHVVRRVGRAAEQRAQPRQQLAECERLDEVVVRAGVESGDAVRHRLARGEHEDRRGVAGRRMRRQSSMPSIWGISTSSTTASTGLAGECVERLDAVTGVVDPVALVSERPFDGLAYRRSSSTTRIRTTGVSRPNLRFC